MNELTERIVEQFEPARDPLAAEPMARYMRDQFPFLGIASTPRRALQRAALRQIGVGRDDLLAAAVELWRRSEREYQYAACDLLARHVTLLRVHDLTTVRALVTAKSWWDTVDALAIHVVGRIVLADRAAGDPVIDTWIDDDLWSARTALLHQNTWKGQTDQDRLFAFCLRRADHTDFFVRKAIGWALREYSKTAPDAVRHFVDAHEHALSGLSKREARKVLNRGR